MKALKNSAFVFVVRVDNGPMDNDLNLIVINSATDLKDNPGCELFGFHSITSVKRHCLERTVQRLNLTNIRDALDEIVDSIPLLIATADELIRRPDESYGKDGFKRHIPTKNGALLLKAELSKSSNGIPIMENKLVTWIHKNQFKATQGLAISDLLFSLLINECLSDPRLSDNIKYYQDKVDRLIAVKGVERVEILALGHLYSAQKFINTLKDRKFLDFIIDFESAV